MFSSNHNNNNNNNNHNHNHNHNHKRGFDEISDNIVESDELDDTNPISKSSKVEEETIFKYNWSLSKALARAQQSISNFEEPDELVLQSELEEYIHEFAHINIEDNRLDLANIWGNDIPNEQEQGFCTQVSERLTNAGRQLPQFNFIESIENNPIVIHHGIIEDPVEPLGHVTYVLTASCDDESRCNFIKDCWESDLKTDDHVYIVMAQRDYTREYLQAIGLYDLEPWVF